MLFMSNFYLIIILFSSFSGNSQYIINIFIRQRTSPLFLCYCGKKVNRLIKCFDFLKKLHFYWNLENFLKSHNESGNIFLKLYIILFTKNIIETCNPNFKYNSDTLDRCQHFWGIDAVKFLLIFLISFHLFLGQEVVAALCRR